ncbi:recombinase [Mycobacterium sp. ENV421]|uniref:tyrosine-type recombinase/integrase n=1 Tax=Mycobacterium sp. ENV421 TaxID=1213407 RepID=UPI000C9C03A3|nr:tyrosine-type recombinase/integrase [Mycobacterium sp. ENV421]PND54124.1 recombinase [Mycobacterium sp. ENV421]
MSSSDDLSVRNLHTELALNAFEHFLSADKGLSVTTRECYLRHVLPFLTEMGGDTAGTVDVGAVSAQRVRSYVTDLGGRYSPQSLKLIATAIRSFLGFAWMSGWTACDLRPAVGVVVTHRFGRLPKALAADDLKRLLAVPDRRTTMGSRDYALLVVLSRLGLRAGEVAGLRLDDFDWRAATLSPTVKGGRRLRLPIPHDVGRSVVAYLHRRPTGVATREVFLQVRGAPRPMTSRAVSQVVARCATRAGLGTVRAHRLRHSAARAILCGGGNLAEVGELLGHSNGQVTMAYASFDLQSLAALVRPWPVEVDHA